MSERELDAIDASLRRLFEPPSLDALGERVAAAAALVDEHEAERAVGPRLRLVDLEEPAADLSDAPKVEDRTRVGLGLLLAVAVAAAIVLVLARPRAPEQGMEADEVALGSGAETQVASASPRHLVAGQQLDRFLRSEAYGERPVPNADCVADGPAPIVGGLEMGAPTLDSSSEHRLVWECGGWTGVDCSAHDLPAQRLMVVQLMPAGPHVIVCIEPPWADPEPQLPARSGYNIFRRTLGDYVLYEVTPLDVPRAVDSISI